MVHFNFGILKRTLLLKCEPVATNNLKVILRNKNFVLGKKLRFK